MTGRDAIWVALLGIMQMGDLWTTALDRAKGAIEGMPVTAGILAERGLIGLAVLKLLMLLAVAVSLAVTYQWHRQGGRGRALHGFALHGCRISVVAVALVTLENAALFHSL